MEQKNTGKIIALLVLMFMSSFGNTTSELLNMGVEYDVAGERAFLLSFASVVLSSILMMAVPFIVRILNKEKLPNKRGKRLCLWNSIILFVLSTILLAMTEVNFIGGIGAIIYYFINKWIFVSEQQSAVGNMPQQQSAVLLRTDVAKPPPQPETRITAQNLEESWNTSPSKKQQRKNILIVVVISLVCVVLFGLIIGFLIHNFSASTDKKETSKTTEGNGYIKYNSYYVGIRAISVGDEYTAQYINELWKHGEATEESMIKIMNEYGAEQGGGQLYVVEPGMWIEEVDEWCFDRTRKIGDVAIVKNAYGYTICYFSSVIER